MQAIPQPSGWPDFGFGCGQPKSRKFLPVSASCRNAMSVSTGAGFWLTIASMRHMSAQLVPDLPEECHPLRPVFLGLQPFRPLSVDDPEDASAPPGRGDDDVDGIRGRGVHGHDFGHVAQRPQDVDRICVLQEDDEEVAGPDREGVLRGERSQAFIVPLHADQARPGGLAERHAEFDPGNGTDERLVHVFRRLDEVGLTEDYVQPARVLDGDEFRFHRHRRCIGPCELSLLLAKVEVRYVHAEGKGPRSPIGTAWRESKGCGRSWAASTMRRIARISRSWRPRFRFISRAGSRASGPSSNSWRFGFAGRPREPADGLEPWSSSASFVSPGTWRTTGPRCSRSSTARTCPRRSPSSSAYDLSGARRGLLEPLEEPGRTEGLVTQH